MEDERLKEKAKTVANIIINNINSIKNKRKCELIDVIDPMIISVVVDAHLDGHITKQQMRKIIEENCKNDN